jgi:hypothetical protein
MVRLVSEEELPAVIDAGDGVWESLPLPGRFNPEHWKTRMASLMRAGLGILVADFDSGGKILAAAGGLIAPEMHCGDLIGQQAFVFTSLKRRGSGLKVLRTFEKECFARGAQHVFLTHLVDGNAKRMSRVFKRWGYLPAQISHVKGRS